MENLKALVFGKELNAYQRALAQREFKDMAERLELLEKAVENNGDLPPVSNRIFKCERCGTVYIPVSGIINAQCCTAYCEHRTSKICGGALTVTEVTT